MFPVGGVGVMLVGAVLSGGLLLALASAIRPRFGWTWSICLGLLAWSIVVIGLVTLIPAEGAPGVVPAEGRLSTCSWDVGGPAPDGQRLLNILIFVPPGALVVLLATRWRRGWMIAPVGLLLLAAYSAGIEATQLALARIDRACDVTDVVDNTIGAALGVLVGLLLALLLRPAMNPADSRDRH